jgi:hypothetical protein
MAIVRKVFVNASKSRGYGESKYSCGVTLELQPGDNWHEVEFHYREQCIAKVLEVIPPPKSRIQKLIRIFRPDMSIVRHLKL